MRHVRLAALVMVLAAASCYSDAAPESTLPEPHYVSGPPGGAVDPSYAGSPYAAAPYARPPYPADPRAAAPGAAEDADGPVAVGPGPANRADSDEDSDSDDADDADDTGGLAQGGIDPSAPPGAPPAELPPGVAGPVGPGPDQGPYQGPGDGIAQTGPDPGAPADPTGGVSDGEIDATLDGYGQWIDTDDYGQVWRPDATVVGVDFTPYESGGSWAYTDAGWAFACDYPWGWLPFHYGRWAWFRGYWGWVPGHRWGPAWVEWRHGGGVVGWRPLPPHSRGPGDNHGHHWHGGDAPLRDHRHPEQHDAHWRFATTTDFARPHIRSHLFGNPAEGLRLTTRVARPPIRGAATLRATDLMRNRFAAGARLAQPGRVNTFHPAQPRGPGQSFQPPARTFQPRGPVQSFQQPPQTARPPTYRPGQPGRFYQPLPGQPSPGQATQPGRPNQPPVRTYQPPPGYRPPVYQPGRPAYQPPVRTYQPPQGYRPPVYQPGQPGRPAYQPPQGYRPPVYQPGQPGQPARPFQPSPSRPFQPPTTFQPHPSTSPVAPPPTWTPPAHASTPPPISHPTPPPAAPSNSSTPSGHRR